VATKDSGTGQWCLLGDTRGSPQRIAHNGLWASVTHINQPPQPQPPHSPCATSKIARLRWRPRFPSVNVADRFEILGLLSTSRPFQSNHRSTHSATCLSDGLRSGVQRKTMLMLGRRSVRARGESRHTIRTMRRWMVGRSQHSGAKLMIQVE
jgi:hypothetical protein